MGASDSMNDALAWYVLGRVATSDTGEMHTEVRIPPESLWFAGHFPGEPILPGIAQLGIAYDAVCKALGHPISVTGFSRVKFKKIIRPRDCLKVIITPKEEREGVYVFRIVVGDDLACSGTMTLGRRNDIHQP
jgi:3-hydroxymyristoyl/3-hydroxydecanoyl-(acyl carrier protein) dehydratase